MKRELGFFPFYSLLYVIISNFTTHPHKFEGNQNSSLSGSNPIK